MNIFRICQEATANMLRHANASSMKLSTQSARENSLFLTIEDNGKGFLQTVLVRDHYGLENMRSRAEEISTILSVISGKNTGTKSILDLNKSPML